MSTANAEAAPKGRAWLWPALIVAGLALHVTTLVIVVLIATRDPSFAVEPNHYQKALRWDATAARLRESHQLGWAASLQLDPVSDVMGRRHLVCRIRDKNGVNVVGAIVHLVIFHHARAADRVHVTLDPEQDGTYTATVPMKRPGLWECRVDARRGDDVFDTVVMQDVPDR